MVNWMSKSSVSKSVLMKWTLTLITLAILIYYVEIIFGVNSRRTILYLSVVMARDLVCKSGGGW